MNPYENITKPEFKREILRLQDGEKKQFCIVSAPNERVTIHTEKFGETYKYPCFVCEILKDQNGINLGDIYIYEFSYKQVSQIVSYVQDGYSHELPHDWILSITREKKSGKVEYTLGVAPYRLTGMQIAEILKKTEEAHPNTTALARYMEIQKNTAEMFGNKMPSVGKMIREIQIDDDGTVRDRFQVMDMSEDPQPDDIPF
jgi:hypothetical protein